MRHVTSSSGQPAKDGFDYAAGRAYLQKKQAALQAKRLALWQKAQEDAQKIIEMIIRHYDPQQVIQWGSVLEPQHFSEASDIDLGAVALISQHKCSRRKGVNYARFAPNFAEIHLILA